MTNECGTCVLCCQLQPIPALNKERNTLCEHACAGCKIYPERPAACRTYDCLWLSENMPVELKPSTVGACFEDAGNPELVNLRCPPFRFNSLWGDSVLMGEIKRRLHQGQKVVMTDGVRASVFVTDATGKAWGLLRGHLRGLTEAGDEKIYDFREPYAQGMM